MKKQGFLILVIVLVSSFSYAQIQKNEKDSIKYFDEHYQPISQLEFESKKWTIGLMGVEGDSINHKILSVREERGKIVNKKQLDSVLTLATNKKIDSSKPIVIIYYPGKDPCNSSGISTRKSSKHWYNSMEKGINKIKESTIIYVYKESEGLYGRNDGYKDWIKDPNRTIERLFFKRHYPCNSFVVISEDGEYISSFGEIIKEYVWKATQMLSEK